MQCWQRPYSRQRCFKCHTILKATCNARKVTFITSDQSVQAVTNLFVTGARDHENARDRENACDQVAPTSHVTYHVTSGPLGYHVTYHVTHHVIQPV